MPRNETAKESKGEDETCYYESSAPSVFTNHSQELSDAGDKKGQDDCRRHQFNASNIALLNHVKQTSSAIVPSEETKQNDFRHFFRKTNPLDGI